MNITKKEVETLIKVHKKDTFFNHIKTVFGFNDNIPFGDTQNSQVIIWKQDFWNRWFYPIFTFEFDTKNHLINIKDRLNPVGKLICYFGILIMLYIILPKEIEYFDIKLDWKPLVIKLFIFTMVFILSKKIYRTNLRDHLEQIHNQLDIEIETPKSQNEWSLKNILIRLFTYPFCVFLIFLMFSLLIPNKEYIYTTLITLIVSAYLISDLKILFKKK